MTEEYSEDDQRTLTHHLLSLTTWVHRGETRGRHVDIGFLCDLHRALFDGVRGHAGRIRDRGIGTEYLNFGPNRSQAREKVREDLTAIFEQLRRGFAEIRDAEGAEDYDERALLLAVRVHADVVKVHPFEDGNGRTSRLLAGHVLVTLGLRPVPIEAVKQEYTDALNHYFREHDLRPLFDLYLSLYAVDR